MQKGQTLIEVVLSLLILSLCLLCSGLVVLKSIQTSKLALDHTHLVLCIENMANHFATLQSHQIQGEMEKEMERYQNFCKENFPSLKLTWQMSQDSMRCALTFNGRSEKIFQKYQHFTIDKAGVVHF